YIESETTESYFEGEGKIYISDAKNGTLINNTGFTEEINQESLKSLITFTSGTMYMGDAFESGNQITSIKIGDAFLTTYSLNVVVGQEMLLVLYDGIRYCESNPEAYVSVYTYILRDRTIQFYIVWIDCFIWKLATMLTQKYFYHPLECPITLKITKGIYNGSEDGNGFITDEKLIYNKSISVPESRTPTQLTIFPSSICRTQTTENNCTTKSVGGVRCGWCPIIKICDL
ncbi:Egg protein, partial [Schistosoma japonicum]